jgi:hypothetical protein
MYDYGMAESSKNSHRRDNAILGIAAIVFVAGLVGAVIDSYFWVVVGFVVAVFLLILHPSNILATVLSVNSNVGDVLDGSGEHGIRNPDGVRMPDPSMDASGKPIGSSRP